MGRREKRKFHYTAKSACATRTVWLDTLLIVRILSNLVSDLVFGTKMALVTLVDDLYQKMGMRHLTQLILLDVSAAFSIVSHGTHLGH